MRGPSNGTRLAAVFVVGGLVGWAVGSTPAAAQQGSAGGADDEADEAGDPEEGEDDAEGADAADAEEECLPACRRGYVCVRGECVSACNPPCADGEVCTEERECVPDTPVPGSGAAEPSPPTPPPDPAGHRFVMGLHSAFGGEADIGVGGGSSSDGLAPTVGVHLRAEFVLHDYFVMGPMFVLGAWNTDSFDDSDIGRSYFFDLDVLARARYPFALGSAAGEAYVGIPVGFTSSFLGKDLRRMSGVGDAGLGYNVGVWLGTQLFFGPVGIVAELGYLRHSVTHPLDSGLGTDDDFEITTNQAVLNVGAGLDLGRESPVNEGRVGADLALYSDDRLGSRLTSLSWTINGRLVLGSTAIEATMPVALVKGTGDNAASGGNLTVGSLFVHDAGDLRFETGGMIALPTAERPGPGESIALQLASASRGTRDLWLWSPQQLSLILPIRLTYVGNGIGLGVEPSLAVSIPVDDVAATGIFQVRGWGGYASELLRAGLSATSVTRFGPVDEQQASAGPFVEVHLDRGFVGAEGLVNIDRPFGFVEDGAEVWGVRGYGGATF